MGCDGGTIPRRDELVRTKKKPEQKDKDAEREFRWLHCALTQQRLQEPIVMCGLGRLYSKQSIIEQLLEKDKMPESIKHIKSMKDIKTLDLTANPAYTEEDKTEGLLDSRHAPFICKLIGLEMSGKFRFVALWSCGCVMSERALKQIGSKAKNCPLCQAEFSIEDVIVLNATDEEEIEVLNAKMEMRHAKRKAAKKDKNKSKEKNGEESKAAASNEANEEDKPSTSKPVAKTSNLPSRSSKANGINGSKAKILGNPKRLGTNAKGALEDPEIKRLKTDYSVAKDPKASDVYKSLFTTHQSEKEQDRAHWVTYNPFYN